MPGERKPTKFTAAKEELTGEDAVLLVPPGDSARLADAVRAVLTDPGRAARLRKEAADRAEALATPADAVAADLAEYDHVVASAD